MRRSRASGRTKAQGWAGMRATSHDTASTGGSARVGHDQLTRGDDARWVPPRALTSRGRVVWATRTTTSRGWAPGPTTSKKRAGLGATRERKQRSRDGEDTAPWTRRRRRRGGRERGWRRWLV